MALSDDIGSDLLHHYEVGTPSSGFVTLGGTDNNYLASLVDRVAGAHASQAVDAQRPRYRRNGTPNGRPSFVLHEDSRSMSASLALPAGHRTGVFAYVKMPLQAVRPDPDGYTATLLRGSGQNVHGLLRPITPSVGANQYRMIARFTGGLQDVAATSPVLDDKWHRIFFMPLASGAVWKIDGVVCDPDFTGNDTMQAVDQLIFGGATPISGGEIAFYALIDLSDPQADYEAIINQHLDDVYETDAGVAASPRGGWYPFKMGHVLHTPSNNRTHFGTTGEDGKQRMFQYEHASGVLSETLLYDALTCEMHRLPTVIRRASDGRLLVFYSFGTGGFGSQFTQIGKHLSTNPDDSSSWGARQEIDPGIGGPYYYYLQPFELDDGIYLFFKKFILDTTMRLYWIRSTDGGDTWSAPTLFFQETNQRPYFTACPNGTERVDFAFNRGHPNETIDGTNGIYHAYFQGGSWFATDGTPIVAPFGPDEATEIYDGSNGPSFFQDIAIDGAGNPVIVYQHMPGRNEMRYRYARWNGSAWLDNEIVATVPLDNNFAGGWTHAGCSALDSADPDIVYLGRVVSGQVELYKYVAENGGTSFTAVAMTANSTLQNHQPRVPRNASPDIQVMWWRGLHTFYTEAVGSVMSSPLQIGANTGALVASIGEIALAAMGLMPVDAELIASIGDVTLSANGVHEHGPVRAVSVQPISLLQSGRLVAG